MYFLKEFNEIIGIIERDNKEVRNRNKDLYVNKYYKES